MIIANIEAERARRGMTIQEFTDSLGIQRKTYYNWREKGSVPQRMIERIAALFGCSADSLVNYGENSGAAAADDASLLDKYRCLNAADKYAVKRFIEFLSNESIEEETENERKQHPDPGGN